MIKNHKQYQDTKKVAVSFSEKLKQIEQQKSNYVDALDYEYDYNAIAHQHQQLQEEIKDYEQLTNKRTTIIESMPLDQLHEVITKTKLAGEWTLAKIVEKLGYWSVAELQEAERTNYEETPLATILDIIDVLGIEVELKEVTLPSHQYDDTIMEQERIAINIRQTALIQTPEKRTLLFGLQKNEV